VAVSVTADVTVQGQGHQTVLSQIVADRLGLDPADIKVTLGDGHCQGTPGRSQAGTYSCRFSPGTAVAAHLAAVAHMRDKLAGIAANQLNILPDDIEFADGQVRSRSNPDNALPFGRVAVHRTLVARDVAGRHAAGLVGNRRVVAPELEPPTTDDRINTSLTYGFVFDMCARRGRSGDVFGARRSLRVDA